MRNRIQRTVMMGLLIAAGAGAGACAPPLGIACGDGWCPEGSLCTPTDFTCIKSGCGNAVVEAGEECDDGNLNDDDDCLSTCKLSTCGDGKVNLRTEECDDGNLDDEDDCLSTCKRNTCGDGKVNLRTEECDDGNSSNEDDCLVTCKRNTCGDGFVNQQAPNIEACDDGNTTNDDGCDNDCTISLLTYIKASNTDAGDHFAISVALSADGSTLAIGASGEASKGTGLTDFQADNSRPSAGAVYVFTHSGTTWRQQAYIKASNTDANDRFGSSVALSADGSILAVGASGEASMATGINGNQTAQANNAADSAGAVYVFTRSGTAWSQQAYVKASNTFPISQFGNSVALSVDGSTLAVGAFGEPRTATGTINNPFAMAGAVYVFTRSGTTWSQQAYIKASNTDPGDKFGIGVALSADGSTLAVGATGEASAATGIAGNQADNSAGGAGAVYVFTRSGTTWSQQAYVKASNTDAGDQFGFSVALSEDGSTLTVGATGEDSATIDIDGDQTDNSAGGAGAVYVFTRSGTTWSQQAYVKASNTGAGDQFGSSVALSADGSTLAVGASGEASAAIGIAGNQADNSAGGAGAVYVFTRSGTTWSQHAYVKASNTNAGDGFGGSVALSADGSSLAAGAAGEASVATGIAGNQADNSAGGAGAVYVYPLPGQQSLITTAAPSESDASASDSKLSALVRF